MSGDTVTREYAVLLPNGTAYRDGPFFAETYEQAVEQAERVLQRAEGIGILLRDLPIVTRNQVVSHSDWVPAESLREVPRRL